MEITIIGSGTCVPSLKRAAPCVMIKTGSTSMLCDTGPGTLQQLLRAGTSSNDIDLIFYSHLHIDHTADLVPLLFAGNYAQGSLRTQNLTIMGTADLKHLYTQLTDIYGTWVIPKTYKLEWIECTEAPVGYRDLNLQTAPLDHTDTSRGLRIEDTEGRSIVYSGDTGYCNEIIALGRSADVLILECSFPDEMQCPGHLTPSLAGQIAAETGCSRLVLTHLYPPCDRIDIAAAAAASFSGEIIVAEDLMKIAV
ncbi:MAG: ribonuclease Z [Deltaproteobacteria bacterium]|nr:ribonuclease Z [Deltaproteobacteria bacterium]